MKIVYKEYEACNYAELRNLIHSLYIEDSECEMMTDKKIETTISFLNHHPDMGKIILFFDGIAVAGYSILINFWSNEYGGMVLYIDELYVRKEYRNRKIGSNFIQYLSETENGYLKALYLEVMPSNLNAYKLYDRIGFKQTGRRHMIKFLNNE